MTDRYVCTADAPWNESKGPRASHPDAKRVREPDDVAFSSDNYSEYECPHCGVFFRVQEADY